MSHTAGAPHFTACLAAASRQAAMVPATKQCPTCDVRIWATRERCDGCERKIQHMMRLADLPRTRQVDFVTVHYSRCGRLWRKVVEASRTLCHQCALGDRIKIQKQNEDT